MGEAEDGDHVGPDGGGGACVYGIKSIYIYFVFDSFHLTTEVLQAGEGLDNLLKAGASWSWAGSWDHLTML